jgi:hypothetical protein
MGIGSAAYSLDANNERVLRIINGESRIGRPEATDAVTFEYPSTTTEIIRFRNGGAVGTILKSLLVTYTDDTKANLVSVEVI